MVLAKACSSQFILNTTVVHYKIHTYKYLAYTTTTTTTVIDHLSIYIFATCLDY